MKTYQLFTEQLKTGPKRYDYVICEEAELPSCPQKLRNFLNNNIGQCINISTSGTKDYFYIKYNNIPDNLLQFFEYPDNYDSFIQLKKNCRLMYLEEIIFFSPNFKETQKELEIILTAKNFNL